MSNPTVDTSKVLVHIQTRRTDAISQRIRPRDGNRHIANKGSTNAIVLSGNVNHPIDEFKSVIQLNYPIKEDGVFRNLVGADNVASLIEATDDDFIIKGFYSDAHREYMLDHMQHVASNEQLFYLNGNAGYGQGLAVGDITSMITLSAEGLSPDDVMLQKMFVGSINSVAYMYSYEDITLGDLNLQVLALGSVNSTTSIRDLGDESVNITATGAGNFTIV